MEIVLFSLLVTNLLLFLWFVHSFVRSLVRSFALPSSLCPLLNTLCVLVFIFTFSELICAMQRCRYGRLHIMGVVYSSCIIFCMCKERKKEREKHRGMCARLLLLLLLVATGKRIILFNFYENIHQCFGSVWSCNPPFCAYVLGDTIKW